MQNDEGHNLTEALLLEEKVDWFCQGLERILAA